MGQTPNVGQGQQVLQGQQLLQGNQGPQLQVMPGNYPQGPAGAGQSSADVVGPQSVRAPLNVPGSSSVNLPQPQAIVSDIIQGQLMGHAQHVQPGTVAAQQHAPLTMIANPAHDPDIQVPIVQSSAELMPAPVVELLTLHS